MRSNSRLIGSLLVTAGLAAGIGFTLHVFAVEWVDPYVASIMAGRTVSPSWDVRVPAALSSIEQGLALAMLYLLLRARLPFTTTFVRAALTGLLTLALAGDLIRQPMMNLLVGNPVEVVAVQDGSVWVIRLVMALIAAYCLDWMVPPEARSTLRP
jgi:hypothetical protein